MQPLQIFDELFPSHRLTRSEEELRYQFKSADCGKVYERNAQKLIAKLKLPLSADLDVWEARGCVREIALVVKMATATPKRSPVMERSSHPADEVPNTEGLDGGWWNAIEE